MTAPELRIVGLGPDDDLFTGWCEMWAAASRAERPDDLPRPAQEHVALGREFVAPGGSRDGLHRAALAGDAVVGARRMLFPLRDNPTVAILDVAVSPAHRRRGLGSALVADGRVLAEARGIREYEASHLARGRTVLSAGAVTGGRLVGFTDLQVPLAQPERASQGGTLVLREHRGHRLGAAMKAAVLRELATAFPAVRRISTCNAESNTPMVAVDEALGFRSAGCLSSWSLRL